MFKKNMTTVQKQQKQQRQQRQQRKTNKGNFLKNLHLKWWVWIIIIVVGINIIGSALAPFLSALTALGKAMQEGVGVPMQLLNFFDKHPWMYYVGFFTWIGIQTGIFGVAKTYLSKKILRDKADGKSTKSSLDEIQKLMEKKLKEVETDPKFKDKSKYEQAREASVRTTGDMFDKKNTDIQKKIKEAGKSQAEINSINEQLKEQQEALDNGSVKDTEDGRRQKDLTRMSGEMSEELNQ